MENQNFLVNIFCATWSFIHENQTLVAGLLGFLGVMCTLAFNAKLQRNEDAERRALGAASLKNALVAEIKVIMRVAETSNKELLKENDPSGSRLVPVQPLDNIFRSVLGDLAALDKETIEAALVAYLSYESYQFSLSLLGVPTVNPNYISVDENKVHMLREMNNSLISTIETQLSKLEGS